MIPNEILTKKLECSGSFKTGSNPFSSDKTSNIMSNYNNGLTPEKKREPESSWCLTLHPSLHLSFVQGRHRLLFPVFVPLSQAFNRCVLLLMLPVSSLFSCTLTPLPIHPEVNGNSLLLRVLTFEKPYLSRMNLSSENTVNMQSCTCHYTWQQSTFLQAFSVSCEVVIWAFMACVDERRCWFYWLQWWSKVW